MFRGVTWCYIASKEYSRSFYYSKRGSWVFCRGRLPVCFSDDTAERPTQDSCRRMRCTTNKNGENEKEDVHTQKKVLESERVEELQNANVILQEYIKLIEEHIALKKELSTIKQYLGLEHK